MTEITREWIAKREELEQAATEGPWSVTHGPRELPCIWSDAPQFESEFIAKCAFAGDVVDAEFIADARTSLPAALAALKAVLELHRPRSLSNYHRCEECSRLRAEDAAAIAFWEEWPCPTAAAIESALRGES